MTNTTSASSSTSPKTKIQKTNRIRLRNATIYASCDAVREVRQHLTRLNQILVPNKGAYYDLLADLNKMVKSAKWRDHFPESSRIIVLQATELLAYSQGYIHA